MIRALLLAVILLQLSVSSGANDGPTRLELKLDRDFYHENVQNTVYLQATINTGGSVEELDRPILNIAIAVDRSGSMEGDKIAQARIAVREALSRLSSNDVVSVISYGSEVETSLPATVRDKLTGSDPAAESLVAEGGCDLFGGISQAATELRRHRAASTVNRIILVSDGKPTKGIREREEFAKLASSLAAEGIAISAIGLGDEFDEALLYQLASPSGGTLRSVRDPADLPRIVATEISQLNQAYAKDAVLEVVFGGSIEIEESLGRPAETTRHVARYRFDHLYPHQELSVILQAQLPASESNSRTSRIAQATLTYTPLGDPLAPPVTINAEARARFTQSSRHSYESIHSDVLGLACNYEVASSIRDAFDLYDQGKSKRALSELNKTARDIAAIERDFDEVTLDEQRDELNRAIAVIESREMDPIERKALTTTLYQQTHRGAPAKSSAP